MTDNRTTDQNKLMWAMLRDISKQVTWHGLKYDDSEWKDIFSAAVQAQKMAPAIDGKGVVMLGVSTRKQSKKWLSDMIMIIEVFGAENGVKFTAPKYYESMMEGL
jgi:hypothetical protein